MGKNLTTYAVTYSENMRNLRPPVNPPQEVLYLAESQLFQGFNGYSAPYAAVAIHDDVLRRVKLVYPAEKVV